MNLGKVKLACSCGATITEVAVVTKTMLSINEGQTFELDLAKLHPEIIRIDYGCPNCGIKSVTTKSAPDITVQCSFETGYPKLETVSLKIGSLTIIPEGKHEKETVN